MPKFIMHIGKKSVFFLSRNYKDNGAIKPRDSSHFSSMIRHPRLKRHIGWSEMGKEVLYSISIVGLSRFQIHNLCDWRDIF